MNPYFRVAVAASRPTQVLLVVGVYLFGITVAAAMETAIERWRILLGAVPLVFVAVSIHYANEYADYETDARTERTPFSGGSGALAATGLNRRFLAHLTALTGAVGVGVGILFVAVALLEAEAFVVLVVSTVAGWQYSVGPLKLAWRGWGELTNAALGGIALPVYGAAVVGGPLLLVALASIPFFLLVLLNLFATQWPDRVADAAVGKRTLAVQWTDRRLRRVYVAVALLAGLSVLALYPVLLPRVVVLASVPVVPLVVWGAYGYTRRRVPWPTVYAMVSFALLQWGAWAWTSWA